MKKIYSTQNKYDKGEQIWKVPIAWFQDFLYSYSDQYNVILV